MANVLVTGAAGFIGSHLYKHLKGLGHSVLGIDNMSHPCKQEVPCSYVDVRSYKDLLPYFQECDAVFHLAAQISVDKSIYNPEETVATNVLGTQNILELARKYKVKIIFASSSEVYGSAIRSPMGEDHPLNAHSPYGATKIAGDRLCEAYVRTYRMDIATVRNFNTFGEYQSDDSYGGVIAKFVRAALEDKPLIIYGDGEQKRDYMHIRDAIQAYMLALKEPSLFNCAVNFGTGKTVTINDLAKKIIELTGSSSRIEYAFPRKGEVFELCADIELARSLGFKPQTDFEKDLERYIEWAKGKE